MSEVKTEETVEPQMVLDFEQIKAFQLVINAVMFAQQKGAYTLQDAAMLHEAMTKLVKPMSEMKSDEEVEEVA